MELLRSSVHQAKMEHRRYKGTAAIQRVFEEAYRKLYLFLLVFIVRLSLLRLYFRFCLIGETLCVVELSIVLFNIDGSLKIGMRLIKLLLVKFDITTIEIVICIVFILSYSCFIFNECTLHITLVVECKAQIFVIEGQVFMRSVVIIVALFRLEANGFFIRAECLFKSHRLEVRQA